MVVAGGDGVVAVRMMCEVGALSDRLPGHARHGCV